MPSKPLEETLEYIKRDSVGFRPDYLECLYDYAGMVPGDGVIVEIGCYKGDSTIAMLAGSHPSVQVFTVDPIFKTNHIHYGDAHHPGGLTLESDYEALRNRVRGLDESFLSRLHVIAATSEEALRGWKNGICLGDPKARWGEQIQLLFIDGAHTYENVRQDCGWMEHVQIGNWLVADDWFAEVENAFKDHIATLPQNSWTLLHESTNGRNGKWLVTIAQRNS